MCIGWSVIYWLFLLIHQTILFYIQQIAPGDNLVLVVCLQQMESLNCTIYTFLPILLSNKTGNGVGFCGLHQGVMEEVTVLSMMSLPSCP